jgi:fumarylpyruvate hydrolase
MTHEFVLPAPPVASVAVRGTTARFPVHRIYCVGRNFAEHAAEMGASIDRGQPVFFMKPADAVVATDTAMPFPAATADLHHEVELVVALGRDAPGPLDPTAAGALVWGHGVGLDLTRRDLQARAKERRLPWDTAKGFDRSAPLSELIPVAQAGPDPRARLWLEVNGSIRQQASLDTMVWSVAEIIAELSRLYELRAGDLVFMGTPAGVAALHPGDRFRAGIDGLVEFSGRFAPA